MKAFKCLKGGKVVLFSGTPCQTFAAHNFVMSYQEGKYREQLITVGVLCHGISAPEVWESCKRWMSKQEGSKLIGVNFRDKSKEGYKKSYCRYDYDSGNSIYLPTYLPSSKYIETTIVYNLAIRNSCNHCDCKGKTDACDIIIGDWYAECTDKGRLGTSCIITFTERGKRFVENSLDNCREFSYDKVLEDNDFIEKSVGKSPKRDEFLDNLNDNIWDVVERYYPKKYMLKKVLINTGLYNIVKKIIK